MRIVKLYTNTPGAANGLVTYQMPSKMRLDTIFFAGTCQGAAVGDITYEFSLQSTGQTTVNDAVGVIANFSMATQTAAGLYTFNALMTPIGFQFSAGDRLYINTNNFSAAPTLARAQFSLIFDT